MCGIVGYAGNARALPALVQGIHLLSYRGYDSAGVALQENGSLRVEKDKGRIGDLGPLWERQGLMGTTGVGHTRWATHGPPNQLNAHPQTDATGAVAVVHNGILENDLALREELERDGVKFTSQTDTEVFAHLFARVFREALARTPSAPQEAALAAAIAASRALFERCKGHFALAILHARLPGTIVGLRRGSPLLVGLGVGENLLASDVKALAGRADRVVDMGEDEIAVVTQAGARLFDAQGKPVERTPRRLDEREQDVGKDGHPHFMLKEIHEQPERTYELLAGRIDALHGTLRPDEVRLSDAEWRAISRVDFVACGTAHIASLYGAYALETLARIPCRVIVASEYEARSPVLGPDVLVVAVTQSGETADTKSALEVALKRGARTLGVLNVRDSAIGRAVQGLVNIHSGPETSVASTKAYTGMLTALLLLALRAASARGHGAAPLAELTPWFRRLPDLMRETISRGEAVRDVAREIHRAENMLFLGRGPDAATALEGALKMKELSYIHAEGYPAGEMKHGPIALVSWDVPTVAVATPGPWRDRMLGNVREVKARDGLVILVAADGDGDAAKVADFVLRVPEAHPWIAPIVNVLPLQLLAYETAKRRGCDIDQPRNLAKTVTVQ